jgi:ATP-dependent RNA helicase HelY
LDDFQSKALTSLEEGNNVLVAAPTGAGKTVVADFAIYLARHKNVKAFYTTPIKALSNQKYHDLVEEYGENQVGLLTGDTSINSEANIVVMTTEVLRNMIYERSTTLDALRYVILDEIHFLGDRFRGQVWEEVIIHLPQSVKIVGLSATVSNIEDFGAWIESVRGATSLIVSETRPVPLDQSVMLQPSRHREPEIFDLYQSSVDSSRQSAQRKSPRVNPELISRVRELDRMAQRRSPERESRRGGRNHHSSRNDHSHSSAHRFTPSRWAVVDELDYLDLLPGIYFIFSRAGCDAAVEQCLHAGLELTTDAEARRIRQIADGMVSGTMSTQDLKALHYSSFRFALEQGFAAHHAGMVSLFREIVEKVFEEGLIRVVFATETLALGINMPARSVVIEKLEKFNGSDHVPLTPGEYTQLTGRAGRRGTDVIGHAVVVDHANFDPTALAALSSRRVYPLHSQFSPSFNMAVNLLNVHDYDTARRTLDQSFAQWEASESSTDLEASIATLEETLKGYEEAFACDFGDFKEFLQLRSTLTDLERSARRKLKHTQFSSDKARKKAFAALDDQIAHTRKAERNHPCRNCPDLSKHLKWGNRWLREHKELMRLQNRYEYRTGMVARRFDLICSVLKDLDYLRDDKRSHGFELTWRGQVLRRLYTEKDLLLAECLIGGVFDDLTAQELAAVMSGVIYESRRSSSSEPRHFPGGRNGAIAVAATHMSEIWEDLSYTLEDANLDPPEKLDFGIVEAIFDWSAEKPLARVLDENDFGPGDFVRTCKRLCDVLGQLETAVDYIPQSSRLRDVAREAYDLINRGVVAYSGTMPGETKSEDGNKTGVQAVQ